MGAACRDNIMLTSDFCKDSIALFLCEGGEGLIFERGDVSALMVVADPAFKTSKTSGSRISHGVTKSARVNRLVG